MKIAIMSDSHDNWLKLEEAVYAANESNCELLLHAGDLISPPGISILGKFKGKVKFVWGNNEMERVGITRKMDASENIELAGDFYEDEVDSIRIFMNHYPKYAELAAKSQEYELAIHGHTHLYREEKIGDTILLNPGEIQGHRTSQSTFVVFNTKDQSIEKIQV